MFSMIEVALTVADARMLSGLRIRFCTQKLANLSFPGCNLDILWIVEWVANFHEWEFSCLLFIVVRLFKISESTSCIGTMQLIYQVNGRSFLKESSCARIWAKSKWRTRRRKSMIRYRFAANFFVCDRFLALIQMKNTLDLHHLIVPSPLFSGFRTRWNENKNFQNFGQFHLKRKHWDL